MSFLRDKLHRDIFTTNFSGYIHHKRIGGSGIRLTTTLNIYFPLQVFRNIENSPLFIFTLSKSEAAKAMELNVVPSGNGTASIGSPFPSPANVSIRQIFGICLTLTLFSSISAFSISTFTLSLAYIRVTGTVTVIPVVTSTSSLAPSIGIDTLSIDRNGKR